MGMVVWLVLLALCLHVQSTLVDPEHDILPYLRGMEWRNVEKELRKDLRLDPSVRPISYDLNLNVSVRGNLGAKRSTFDGFVLIVLNVTASKDTIELHSVGLNIQKARLITSSSIVEISKFEYNRERETVKFTLPRTLQPNDSAQLKVYYNGTSAMRGFGLFEYWTKPEKENPSSLPTISLVTNCEPSDARRWLPSFDEPDKKATFRLRVTHPTELTAYSNTAVEEMITVDDDSGVTTTTFHPTAPLPTYLVALSLTQQPVATVDHNGQKISAIGPNGMKLVQELKQSMDNVRSLPVFENVTFFPEKTAWLIVEEGMGGGAMENPGLITSGKGPFAISKSVQIHELVHMYFGNLVTLRSWEQIWINEGFASFFQDGGAPRYDSARILGHIHTHEAAMHEKFSYTRTQFVSGHFFRNSLIHYNKAGQLISLIKRFIGKEAFERALNRYLIDNSFGNGDSAMMIDYLSSEVPQARQIMSDWVYQKGVALVTVEEEEGQMVIHQRRFLRTDFNEELRDKITRWTIPLYYTLNGVEHMAIMPRDIDVLLIKGIPANSTFSIDNSYPHLYAVHYPKKKSNDALSQVIVQAEIADHVPDKSTFVNSAKVGNESKTANRIGELRAFCDANAQNKSNEQLFEAYLIENDHNYLVCDSSLQSRAKATIFLRDLLFDNALPIRQSHQESVGSDINEMLPGIFMEILTEDHANAEYLDSHAWPTILDVVSKDDGGVDKIREIIRSNPAFGANLFYTITALFEDDYIKTERAKRKQNIVEENFSMKEQEAEILMI